MLLADFVRFTVASLAAHRLRTILTALGIAVGIAAVMLLTAIGEGLHRFVIAEFTQFGTTLVAVNPGKIETSGAPGALGGTVNPHPAGARWPPSRCAARTRAAPASPLCTGPRLRSRPSP